MSSSNTYNQNKAEFFTTKAKHVKNKPNKCQKDVFDVLFEC